MTITVESGITMRALTEELARQGQRLPVDVPQAGQATLGGVVASATSGPRRFGHGAIRDFVIGLSAVDGRGVPFKAGGRVVKNVAGYDLCKLLTGSRGALAVITQVTLKLRPVAEATAFVVCDVAEFAQAEPLFAQLGTSPHGAPWPSSCWPARRGNTTRRWATSLDQFAPAWPWGLKERRPK